VIFDLSKIKNLIPPEILDRLVPDKLFSRLNIANKMLLGYVTLSILTIIVVVYTLVSFLRLNHINKSMVNGDIRVQEAADKMLDALLAQDMYEKRYLILKSDDMLTLFVKRGDEFKTWMTSIKDLPDRGSLPIDTIESLHREYDDLFLQEVQFITQNNVRQAKYLSNEKLKSILDKLLETIKVLSVQAKTAQEIKMKRISIIGGAAFLTTAVLWFISLVAGAVAGLVVTHHISSSLHKLKVATQHISEGNFDYDPQIGTQDEIGSLSSAFIEMGKRLRKLEEMYLDASPLTRLPGGIAIENVLKKRLETGRPIAFCVLDLDNFKPFSDRYGYAHGSEVIKETARIIEQAVRTKGASDDFVGHIGGDDFVVITTPGRAREISADIIKYFDQRIPAFYDEQDRRHGHILGKTRQGVEMQFPLMTISIAIVTNEDRTITNPLEASEIAAELKDHAKTMPKSVFVMDTRKMV